MLPVVVPLNANGESATLDLPDADRPLIDLLQRTS